MAMTAYQTAMLNKLQAGDIDPDQLKKAGVAQMGAQMSNANSAVAQATANAVKGTAQGAVNPAAAQANNAKAQAQANTPEQTYMASYLGGAVNPTVSAGAGKVENPTVNFSSSDTINPMGEINNHYFAFGRPDAGFQNSMSAEDQASWNAIGKKFAAGDTSWNKDTNPFREDGKWGSFTDANGNVNGWLYAADGMGGYAPVFGGKVGESGYKSGTVFYGPDGTSYMMGPDGTLSKNGTVEWLKYGQSIGPQTGYHNNGGSFIGKDAAGNLRYYDYDTVSDADLERMGYYRDQGGMINLINNDYYIAKGIRNGQITPEQAQLANDWNGKMKSPGGSTWVRDNVWGVTPGGSVYPSGGNGGGGNYPSGGGYIPYGDSGNGGGGYPSGANPSGSGVAPTTNFQDYLAQWDYEQAPEWAGSEYKTKEDEHLQNAENMDWTESEHVQKAEDLLEQSLQEYGGSEYDPLVDEALQKYGEEWGGSPYKQKADEHLQNAENMKWNYNPETDPVWQALQKQYRREGDRATRQTMGQAAAMTGGVPSSYAATAAAQAGNYYAAQLSDRLPQVYQDAYNRYLQEYQRQMGLSDQYAAFDQTEYSRWNDQQGKNLDLADRYNLLSEQDRQKFKDRMDQLAGGAEAYWQLGQDAYSKKLDEYDRQIGLAETYGKLVGRDRDWYNENRDQYNTDRNFSYGRYRDAVGDARYDDETAYSRAWNEEARAYNRAYQAQRDAILDNRADREWAQELRAYADAQQWKATEWEQYLREYGDQLSDKQRQWAYQMQRDALSDERWERQYTDQRSDTMYNRALQEDQTAWQKAVYDQEYADQRNDTAWEQGYKQTAYNDEMERTALNYLNTNGIVTGRYAEILGVPDGTTYEQYYSRYLGGGSSSPFEETEIPSGTTPKYTPPPIDDGDGDYSTDLSMVGNRASRDWVALDDNQRVSWQELYTLVENGDVEEYYKNGKYYYRWKNLKVPEGKQKEAITKAVYENRGGR